jgi:arginyl-tRNA synthetase
VKSPPVKTGGLFFVGFGIVLGMEAIIRTALERVLQELGVTEISFVVEHPAEVSHGDYATNVALAAAKPLGASPRQIAEQLVSKLQGTIPDVADITIAGPGFINFHLARTFFTKAVGDISVHGEAWGSNTAAVGQNVMLEYTSPNLFKPLHVGNLVGNIIGESLGRLMELSGAVVKRFNYPSDIGLTVAKGVWGLKKTGADPRDIVALGTAYRLGNEAYEAEGPEKDEIVAINKALYEGTNAELNALRAAGIATSKARLSELLTVLGTTFDHVIHESEVSEPGIEIVRAHEGTTFDHSDGAVVYKGEKVGLHTRVFINSAGLPTYEAKDLGNYALKNAKFPEWTMSIIVTGNEQTEYFKVLYAAIRELYPETKNRVLEHVPTGFLTLTTGKMSSRKGNVLTGESLLEEMEEAARLRAAETRTDNIEVMAESVAVAALKYQILRHNTGSNIVFDKEKALSFEGDSGPYLQYTHARIVSVLEKARAAGVVPSTAVAPAEPYAIERLIYRFPEVVEVAYHERAPHKVTTYLTELAGAFNSFYATEKIADANDLYAPYKAAVAEAVALTLRNGLWVLGIKAPERM